MKTWDDWSDKYLSKLVAEKIGLTVGDKLSMMRKNSSATVHNGDGYWIEFDINNPADIWPIILENNIVVTTRMGVNIGDATGYSEHQNPVISEFDDNNKALLAAAIVFLMMNGVNPE